jgi:hypothetical protein
MSKLISEPKLSGELRDGVIQGVRLAISEVVADPKTAGQIRAAMVRELKDYDYRELIRTVLSERIQSYVRVVLETLMVEALAAPEYRKMEGPIYDNLARVILSLMVKEAKEHETIAPPAGPAEE